MPSLLKEDRDVTPKQLHGLTHSAQAGAGECLAVVPGGVASGGA